MPGKILPSFTRADIESHNTAKSCYVTLGSKVYDVTSFVDDHPGGGDLILEYAGRDIEEILMDTVSHEHSDAAYEILDDCHIGFVADSTTSKPMANGGVKVSGVDGGPERDSNGNAVYATTGMSKAEDLEVETDLAEDYRTHKFLDLNRALLPQLWFGGFDKYFYLEQVHRPRHYKGGASAPLFGNFLEPLSKAAWWIIPTVWLPPVMYGSALGAANLSSPFAAAAYWLLGLFIWTLLEYILHRCLFHIDNYLPNNRVGICLHFLLHGIHHYLPMDRYRLVMPPPLFVILATPFYQLAHTIFWYNWYAAIMVYCGGVFGYICYDMTHYFLHHRSLPSFYQKLKKYHLKHHFADYENGFGVTSRFWDVVFGTELQDSPKAAKTE